MQNLNNVNKVLQMKQLLIISDAHPTDTNDVVTASIYGQSIKQSFS
jgi:hypothetical protein